MAFRFRLDTVLRHRNRTVDDRSREVAAAEARFLRLHAGVQELETALAQAYGEGQYPDGGPMHLGDLMARRRWFEYLGHRRAQLILLRNQALVTRDQARRRLNEAWRQREVLERLRTRRAQEHRNHLSRVETLAMDEIASVRHAAGMSAQSAAPAEIFSGGLVQESSQRQSS